MGRFVNYIVPWKHRSIEHVIWAEYTEIERRHGCSRNSGTRRGVGWKIDTHSRHTRSYAKGLRWSGRVVKNAFFRCKDGDEFVDFHRCLNWKIACRVRKTIHHMFNRIASSSVCPPSANRAHALPKRVYFVLTAAECNKTRLEKKKNHFSSRG